MTERQFWESVKSSSLLVENGRKKWMQECCRKRPTHEKKDSFQILKTELCSDLMYSHKAGQLQAVCATGWETMILPRYLDSIVDCNRATCSQRMYAKIYIYIYIIAAFPNLPPPLYLLSQHSKLRSYIFILFGFHIPQMLSYSCLSR